MGGEMKRSLVAVGFLFWTASVNAAELVHIGPPAGDLAPGGVITAPPDAQKPGTEANKQFLRALSIVGTALLIGGEKACSFSFDQTKVAAAIDKDAPTGDKTFHKQVVKQIDLVKKSAKSWSAATIARTCPQIADLAHDEGLLD